MKGFPLEFDIGARGPEYFYDGATRWSKKFKDRFSRFDTIPAVTDTQPATQPRCRSKYTRYASASRSKKSGSIHSRWIRTRNQIMGIMGRDDDDAESAAE